MLVKYFDFKNLWFFCADVTPKEYMPYCYFGQIIGKEDSYYLVQIYDNKTNEPKNMKIISDRVLPRYVLFQEKWEVVSYKDKFLAEEEKAEKENKEQG